VKGLPQRGFPYAVATSELRPSAEQRDVKVHVLRVDPKAIRPAGSAGTTEETPTVVSLFAPQHGALGLFWQDDVFLVAMESRGVKVAGGVPVNVANASQVAAVIGVEDLDGLLDWVEIPEGADRGLVESVDKLLTGLGCSKRIAIEHGGKALLGGTDLAGQSVAPPPPPFVRFVRGSTPSARLYFPSTPVVPASVWQPLQAKRVRYFPKAPKAAPSSSAPAPAAPPSAPASSSR
jgi:hypothetical protein